MNFLDHGNCLRTTRNSRDTPAVRSDNEQSYLPATMESSLDYSVAKRAQNPSWNGAERSHFPDSCLDCSIPVKHAWREPGCRSIARSNIQPTLDLLLSRIQALEDKVRSPRSVVAQHPAAYEKHVSCALGTQSFPLSTLTINTPYAIAGPERTWTQAPYGQQDERKARNEYNPLHLNNAVATSISGFSPVAVGDPDNIHVNPGVNAGSHRDDQSATIQDWNASLMLNDGYDNGNFADPMVDLAAAWTGTQVNVKQSVAAGPASQMTDNFGYNSYSEIQSFDDLFDFTGASGSSNPGAAARDGISVAPQVDAGHLTDVVAPRNMISTSSGNQGAATSRPRRHLCTVSMQCHKSFARRADRDRHELTHNQNSYLNFPCPFPGCDRGGTNGFCRADKLKSHRTKRGH